MEIMDSGLKIGDRFTAGQGRYDKRIWRVMRIEETSFQVSGPIVHYACNAEGTIDWWWIAESTIPEKLEKREVRILDEKSEEHKAGWADALNDPKTAEAVTGFIEHCDIADPVIRAEPKPPVAMEAAEQQLPF